MPVLPSCDFFRRERGESLSKLKKPKGGIAVRIPEQEMADETLAQGPSESGGEAISGEESRVAEPEPEPEPEQDGVRTSTIKDEGPPRVGMVFKTFEEVYDFFNEYARLVGFGTKIRRSFYSEEDGQCNKFTLTCSKEGKRAYKNSERCTSYSVKLSARTNCQVKIKAQKYVDGLFHLVEVNLEHNHPVNPSMARFFRSHKGSNKGLNEKLKKLPVMRAKGMHPSGESEQENSVGKACPLLNLGVDGFGALHEFFLRMQASNTNFFHLMDLDESGRVKNVFWADGKAKSVYQCYGDVVTVDTTCVANNYDTPLVSFIGVNNHGHLVLLGCGLLSSQSTEAFKWLFKVWLSCMSGALPNAIITDHCQAIQEAVAEALPGVRHRLCLWHIVNKIQGNLGGYHEYKAIKGMLKKTVYDSLTADEFEQQWRKMTEKYGLEDNDWLRSLYENRHCWVPVFLKDTFWAGMSATQHKESMNSFFDGYVYPKTSLKQFIGKYEPALQSKWVKETQADHDSFHKTPQLISKFFMEDQLRKIYTVDMFKKFQEEVKAILYCIPSLISVDGPISLIEVKEPISMKECNLIENKNYGVTYNSNEQNVQCACGFFQFQGILCRHALSVLNFLEVYEIPPQYILERWRKDFKHRHVLNCSSNYLVASGPIERYDNLYKCCLKFTELGAISDESYEYASKLISEVTEELIANDCTISDMLPRNCSIVGSNMNGKRNTRNENNETHNLVQMRQQGQPLKKRKESLMEKIGKTSKRKASQIKQIDGSPSNVLHVTPHKQLDTHIWTQETIDLADQVSPTNLSIGNHFGVQLNHQHAIDNQMNQPGMRWSFQQMFQQAHTSEAPPGPWAG